jgi:hypothetical protein
MCDDDVFYPAREVSSRELTNLYAICGMRSHSSPSSKEDHLAKERKKERKNQSKAL